VFSRLYFINGAKADQYTFLNEMGLVRTGAFTALLGEVKLYHFYFDI
jgi:hypothetical protein